MSGVAQELPPEAVGAAVGTFIYSFLCFSLSASLLWATVAHREWKSYVAMLAFYTTLSTLASMAQQLHTYLKWTTIKLAQFDYIKANVGNPELSIAGPSVGIDIVLFYIQFYCYNAEAMLVASWATQLTVSIYQLQPTRSTGRYGSLAAKAVAVCLPMFQAAMLRTSALQANLVAFYFVANILMGLSLAVGIVLLLAILVRYVSTRAEVGWHVQYADRSTFDTMAGAEFHGHPAGTLPTSSDYASQPLHQKSIYDNWLVVRFTLAFAGLAAYQLVIIAAEINFALDNDEVAQQRWVSLHHGQAISDIQTFLPGVSVCILAFIVFGTTKAFCDYFYTRLVPKSIRRRIRTRASRRPTMAFRHPDARLSTAALRSPGRSPGLSPGLPKSPRDLEYLELDGVGVGRGRMSLYELPVPTPTYQTEFSVAHGDEEDNVWPGPNNRQPRR